MCNDIIQYNLLIHKSMRENIDLKIVFQDFINQSNRFIKELEEELQYKGLHHYFYPKWRC